MTGMSKTPSAAEPADGIIAIGPERHQEAVAGLLAYGSRDNHAGARRFLEYARENSVSLESMWSLVDGAGTIRATALGVPSPGQTAMLFATQPQSAAEVPAIARLIDHACRGLRTRKVELAQALLDPGDSLGTACFLEAKFTLLAQLSYMQRAVRAGDAKVSVDWPAGYAVEPYDAAKRAEMVALLEASYIDTLDCPGLVGLREAEDILTGHESVGEKDSHEWHVLRQGGTAVGVVMLNPSRAAETVELVYLGLAPNARGKGLGVKLLRWGIARLAQRKHRGVTLAVDQQNHPAVALYKREGFRVVLERTALIRSLRNI